MTAVGSGLRPAYLWAAARTPFGRFGGAVAGIRPDDLAAAVVSGVLARAGVDSDRVDEVILGTANGAGEDNRNVGRMAVLLAGLPVTVPGTGDAHVVRERNERWGVAAICIGVGQGLAVVLENTDVAGREAAGRRP